MRAKCFPMRELSNAEYALRAGDPVKVAVEFIVAMDAFRYPSFAAIVVVIRRAGFLAMVHSSSSPLR
jgi:hypothetical protein